ncbi:MAG: cAMP-binding proteins - catabolite gene activator and regulatory subunit of cAMP-dependent protein kinases [uncultured Sulfurovum sp.]|uniref:cAMP-binding proteins - catabolite gene activator and regulatory subunit of cAMP-dependent protein kinases n=1 Tax=uncultured Sulfurovum sp. TaxID=269237 RepID=A0A6S6UIU5_9BACT|nr:MAG: cAMP-binding proteins - catabolite gene activator and regulatory subunit of cAMP-dependent protein kinases [uncultured Sulfurovum sp.]
MYKKYKEFIDQYISFNIIEWTLLKSKLKTLDYKKGEIIHYAGDICSTLMFINSGIARAYIIDDEGKDHTWAIYFNDKNAKITNLYVVDYDSFIHKTESHISIEILEDAEFITVTYDDIQFLYNHKKKGERFGRLMSEAAYSYVHNYIIDRRTKSATQRFEEFMEKTPYLLDKVPQYHIATLLGITPQSLSRLKKNKKY